MARNKIGGCDTDPEEPLRAQPGLMMRWEEVRWGGEERIGCELRSEVGVQSEQWV